MQYQSVVEENQSQSELHKLREEEIMFNEKITILSKRRNELIDSMEPNKIFKQFLELLASKGLCLWKNIIVLK